MRTPGFNWGPSSPMSYFGMWGDVDPTIPPLSNTEDPDKSVSIDEAPNGGWFYSTARNTTNLWGARMDCDTRKSLTDRWSVDVYSDRLTCTVLDNCDPVGTTVVECLFDGGHSCGPDYQTIPMIEFMLSHPKPGSTTSPAPSTLFEISSSPDRHPNFFMISAVCFVLLATL